MKALKTKKIINKKRLRKLDNVVLRLP